jgi:hypothetical protein
LIIRYVFFSSFSLFLDLTQEKNSHNERNFNRSMNKRGKTVAYLFEASSSSAATCKSHPADGAPLHYPATGCSQHLLTVAGGSSPLSDVVEKGVIYLNINIEVKECHTKQK